MAIKTLGKGIGQEFRLSWSGLSWANNQNEIPCLHSNNANSGIMADPYLIISSCLTFSHCTSDSRLVFRPLHVSALCILRGFPVLCACKECLLELPYVSRQFKPVSKTLISNKKKTLWCLLNPFSYHYIQYMFYNPKGVYATLLRKLYFLV